VRLKKLFLTYWIAFLLTGQLWAQKQLPNIPVSPPTEPATASTQAQTGIPTCDPYSGATQAACEEALKENYLYQANAFRHRKDVFDWSLTADKLMFAVVNLLVLSGLAFAAIQFRLALKQSHPAAEGKEKADDPMATNMEISTGGIKVTSSVLGVIVLLISMAFFFLYARYVYPIQEVHDDKAGVSQDASKPE
jgi:hypothetical protein